MFRVFLTTAHSERQKGRDIVNAKIDGVAFVFDRAHAGREQLFKASKNKQVHMNKRTKQTSTNKQAQTRKLVDGDKQKEQKKKKKRKKETKMTPGLQTALPMTGPR